MKGQDELDAHEHGHGHGHGHAHDPDSSFDMPNEKSKMKFDQS